MPERAKLPRRPARPSTGTSRDDWPERVTATVPAHPKRVVGDSTARRCMRSAAMMRSMAASLTTNCCRFWLDSTCCMVRLKSVNS